MKEFVVKMSPLMLCPICKLRSINDDSAWLHNRISVVGGQWWGHQEGSQLDSDAFEVGSEAVCARTTRVRLFSQCSGKTTHLLNSV